MIEFNPDTAPDFNNASTAIVEAARETKTPKGTTFYAFGATPEAVSEDTTYQVLEKFPGGHVKTAKTTYPDGHYMIEINGTSPYKWNMPVGAKFANMNYNAAGQLDGAYLTDERVSKNHNRNIQCSYSNGVLNGLCKEFNFYSWKKGSSSGASLVEDTYTYVNGVKHGQFTHNAKGETIIGNYVNGVMQGAYDIYDGKTKIFSGTMLNGMLDGCYEIFDRRGKLTETGTYVDGKVEGEVAFYSADYSYAGHVGYKNGKREGLMELFHDNGKLAYKVLYVNGEENDMAFSYNEDGTLGMAEYFENGKSLWQKKIGYASCYGCDNVTEEQRFVPDIKGKDKSRIWLKIVDYGLN